MKGVLPWMVLRWFFGWAHYASTREFCPALAALVGQILMSDDPAPLPLGDDLEVTLQGKACPSH
jgi:hypothetical protein